MHNRNAGNCHVGPVASTHGPKGRGGPREGRVPSTLVRILLMGGEGAFAQGASTPPPHLTIVKRPGSILLSSVPQKRFEA